MSKRGLFQDTSSSKKEDTKRSNDQKINVTSIKIRTTSNEDIQEAFPFDEESYLEVKEIAEYFNVAKETVYRWIYANKLKGVVFHGSRLVPMSEFKRFASEYTPGSRGRRASR